MVQPIHSGSPHCVLILVFSKCASSVFLEIKIKIPEKITKVLLYNAKNANDSVKIVGSRKMFKDRLNSSWYTRRDNVLVPIEQIINPDLLSNYRKKLNELKLEVWYFPQLDGEDEPVEMVIDEGEPN